MAGLLAGSLLPALSARAGAQPAFAGAVSDLERRIGGRIGVAAVHGKRRLAHRADERFPLCSTFKLLAAGLVLSRVDRGEERLDRRVVFGAGDLVPYSPVTETQVGRDGMSLAEICRAAITRSDNTAGNLLLASFGGPSALTAFARLLGDPVTRLDRIETALNEALPDDPRDTTSPAAMLGLLTRLVLGDALGEGSRGQLRAWLEANETGAARIRAAASASWRVGDKTGTGERGAASDVAVLWPGPDEAPVAIAIFLHGSTRPLPELSAAIAEAARLALAAASDRL